jgi:GNAT superfamily N-acetyltransferase
MEVYKVTATESSREFEMFLGRIQSLSLWYIERATYTDTSDPNYFHYFIYKVTTTAEGTVKHAVAGYATLHAFYQNSNSTRAQIHHFLVLPPFRHQGTGVKLLSMIYRDLATDPSVFCITAETTCEEFNKMRDFTNCLLCWRLKEFQEEGLSHGFTREMENAARRRFKLHEAQSRTVYEIIRLAHTNMGIASCRKAYRTYLTRRLQRFLLPERKRRRMYKGLFKKFGVDQQARRTTEEVKNACETTLAHYRSIIERLHMYAPRLFN